MKYLFHIVIFSGIALGFIFPQLEVYKPIIPWMVGFVLFLNFLETELKRQRFFRGELLVTGSLSALFMPLVVYHVLSNGLNPAYRIGLLLTAIAPSGIMMLAISRFVPNKDYNLILSNFLFTTFGSILYIPLMVKWLVGTAVHIEINRLFVQTGALVLIPYGASEFMKKVLSANTAAITRRYTQGVILIVVFIIACVSISAVAQELVWDRALIILALLALSIFLLQGGLAYLAGLLFWDKSIRNTLAMIASSRNNHFVLGIAIMNFPPITVVPCMLGIIFHHVTNAFWVWLFRK